MPWYFLPIMWLGATVISAQVLLLGDRQRSLRQRLGEIGQGGGAWGLALVAVIAGGVVGATIGAAGPGVGDSAAVGMGVGLLTWTISVALALISSNRNTRGGDHRANE
ncbi:hypothetical protein [Actinopolymorpha rutila]|uniref:Uncharacterized protein n=1 Tax=Actinopolymorpha rutila TaxID=446787 RepID=A0A852ZU10_9ACTN|nr:hypothetical protein [Actinopolymorpha rutila]NYH92829.1 hypothetical protein [Actinopolymorpha rutila]